jgi:hypothetical protein
MVESGSGNVAGTSAETAMHLINKAPKNMSQDTFEVFQVSGNVNRWFHSKISSITSFDAESDVQTYQLYRGEALKYHNEKTFVTSDASGFQYSVDLDRDLGRINAQVEHEVDAFQSRRALQGKGGKGGKGGQMKNNASHSRDGGSIPTGDDDDDGWFDWSSLIADGLIGGLCSWCGALDMLTGGEVHEYVTTVVDDLNEWLDTPAGQVTQEIAIMLIQLAESIPGVTGVIAASLDMIINPSMGNLVDIFLSGAGYTGANNMLQMISTVGNMVQNSQLLIQSLTGLGEILAVLHADPNADISQEMLTTLVTLLGNIIGIDNSDFIKQLIGIFLKAFGVGVSLEEFLSDPTSAWAAIGEQDPGTGSAGGSDDACETEAYECYVTPEPTDDPEEDAECGEVCGSSDSSSGVPNSWWQEGGPGDASDDQGGYGSVGR